MNTVVFGERFNGTRIPAWAEFGTKMDGKVTASQAMRNAHLDYEIKKSPVQYTALVDGGIVGDLRTMEGKYVLYHGNHEMGIVGSDYEPIQNMTLASILDGITETYPVDTVGSVHDGRALFMALDAGEGDVVGEPFKMFFTVANFHGGGRSVKIFFTPIRMYCINMLHTGLAEAAVSVSMAHYKNAANDLRLRVELLNKMDKARSNTLSTFTRFAKLALSGPTVADIIEQVYPYRPMPKKAAVMDELTLDTEEALQFNDLVEAAMNVRERWEWEKTRVDTFRNAAKVLYDKFSDEYPTVGGTGYALFNAITELADWRDGSSTTIGWDALYEKRAQEKSRAFLAINALK